MRILYFSFVELDIPNACQTHTLGVLRGLSYNGCHIDALVPRPLKVSPVIPAVRFFYLWPWRFSRTGRMWIELLSALLMIFLCLRNHYDAIYVREMETNSGPRLTSKLFRIPLYIEINDLIVPVQSENGVPASYVDKIKRHQKADFKQSYGLIIPSIPMCNWIIDQYGLPESKVHMIINGTDETEAKKVSSLQARANLGIPTDGFCLGFVGNIYKRYDFSTILKAIVECQDQIPDLYFVIIGEGPHTVKVKAMAGEMGIADRIIFKGYIQPDKLGQVMPAIDIGLSLLTKKNALRYGPVTTKLSTYALHKVPVISAGISLKGYPKELSQGLFLVPPEDTQALSNIFTYLHNHPEDRARKAKILGDFASKKLTWESVAKEILEIIKNNENSK